MFKKNNLLILLAFSSVTLSGCMQTATNRQEFTPYLEDSRHLQIPQWEHADWYVEDWTSQKPAMEIIQGFYDARILNEQTVDDNEMPVMVVGPNFYRLSGLDKRRVMTLVDSAYGITGNKINGSFMIMDWKTRQYIGTFDGNGLRLH